MKKYRTFTSPFLMFYTFICPITMLLWCSGFGLFLINNNDNLFFYLIFTLIMFLAFYLPKRKAFEIVTFSQEGIKNRSINLKWEEVNYVSIDYSIDYMEIFKNRTFEPPKLKFLYVSTKEQYCSFEEYKMHQNQCILMPMNKKNLNNLLKYSDGRSQAIIDFVALREKTGDGSAS